MGGLCRYVYRIFIISKRWLLIVKKILVMAIGYKIANPLIVSEFFYWNIFVLLYSQINFIFRCKKTMYINFFLRSILIRSFHLKKKENSYTCVTNENALNILDKYFSIIMLHLYPHMWHNQHFRFSISITADANRLRNF